jgi:hypothetical protein
MSKTIELYFSCTKDKLLINFDDDNYIAFLSTGIRLWEGKFILKSYENFDLYILDNNVILGVNHVSNLILYFHQHEKYTYVFTTYKYNRKNTLKKQQRSVSFFISLFNKDDNSISQTSKQLKYYKHISEIFYLDYYKKHNDKNYFYPLMYLKKLSFANAAINFANFEIISLLDNSTPIDLKFLVETFSLENNTLLVPNILHQNSEILPVSFSREVFNCLNMLNENDACNKATINLIWNAFFKNLNIKTYPAVLGNTRIRGDFDNVSEERCKEIVSNFNSNYIIKETDLKIYEKSAIVTQDIKLI